MFGIGKFPENSNFTNESFKFFLYPKNFENQTYLNYAAESDGKSYEFFLYHSNSTDSHGFRVSNYECYQKLVDLIQASTNFYDAKIFGKETPVTLLGEIMYMDKSVEKRWFWPYYGLGWWGFGYPILWG